MRKLRRPGVTLVVGGSGHQTDQLKRFVELLGIEERVEFVGYVPEAELGDYYAAADAFVSPSYAEPFGITITEALESGTQVVATRAGASRRYCRTAVSSRSRSILSRSSTGSQPRLTASNPGVRAPRVVGSRRGHAGGVRGRSVGLSKSVFSRSVSVAYSSSPRYTSNSVAVSGCVIRNPSAVSTTPRVLPDPPPYGLSSPSIPLPP